MQRRLVFIILVLSSNGVRSNKNFTSSLDINPNVKNLHKALTLIVQENFISQTNPLILYTYFNTSTREHFYEANDIIDGVLSEILDYPYRISHNGRKLYSNLERNEVILLDSVDTFSHFFRDIKYIGNLDLSRTLLFISTLTSVDEDIIYMLFQEFYHMEILKVALVVMPHNGDIVLLTYFPFKPEVCRDFRPAIINRFLADQQRWEGDNYFPFKLHNFYGCPIYCCTWEEMPYFGMKRSEGKIEYEGLEAEVLDYLAASINASFDIKFIEPIDDYAEDIEPILTELIDRRCELALGGFAYRQDFDKTRFSQTRSFSFTPVFIVTNVINIYTIYDKLAYPFDNNVWLALGLTFALSFALISICERQRQWTGYRKFLIGSANCTPQFNLYTVAVGSNMTSNNLPKRNFARFLLTCWLLLTFILRIAYQSGMYQMLRDKKQWNPPQTIENVFEQKYLISATPKNQRYLETLSSTQQVRIFNTTVFEAFAEMVVAKEPIAMIVPYEYYGYLYKTNLSLWQNLHLVKERLLIKQQTFYSPHHSLIVPHLNKKLSYGLFHGLLSLWSSKNILPYPAALEKFYSTETVDNKDENSQNNLLTMNELGAIFMILIWLHVLAVVVFFMELMWHRYGNFLKDWLDETNVIVLKTTTRTNE